VQPSAGRVHLFSWTAGASFSWQPLAVLAPAEPAGAAFGASVALSADLLVVGAPRAAGTAGKAFVYVFANGQWSTTPLVLTRPGGAAGDLFGTSVAVSGTTVAVGAPGAGSVTVFTVAGGVVQAASATVTAPPGPVALFGASVALSPSSLLLLVGAPGSAGGAGASFLFRRTAGAWSLTDTIAAQALDGQLGASVALSDTLALIGAPTSEANSGRVYSRGEALQAGRMILSQAPRSHFLRHRQPDGHPDAEPNRRCAGVRAPACRLLRQGARVPQTPTRSSRRAR
jgi:hypothetical protein